MLDGIFKRTNIPVLSHALNLSSIRQRIIAGNIANAGTPGYRQKELDFKESLQRAQQGPRLRGKTSDPKHQSIPSSAGVSRGAVIRTKDTQPDIEEQMVKSAANQLFYDGIAELTTRKFSTLKSVIRGRF